MEQTKNRAGLVQTAMCMAAPCRHQGKNVPVGGSMGAVEGQGHLVMQAETGRWRGAWRTLKIHALVFWNFPLKCKYYPGS